MQPIIPYAGRTAFMDLLISQIQSGGRSSLVHMLANRTVFNAATTLPDLVAVTAPGLTAKPLTAATISPPNISGRVAATFATINFTSEGGGLPVTAYGYWVDFIDPITNARALFFGQIFDNPFLWFAAAQNYPLNISLGGNQC